MIRMKKSALMLAACFTLASFLSACGNKAAEPKSTETKPAAAAATAAATAAPAKPSNIKVVLTPNYVGNVNSTTLIEEVQKVMEAKTNTKIDLQVVPHNTYPEKINILLTSGETLDVFLVQQAELSVPSYAQRGYLLAIDEHMKKSPNLAKLDQKAFDPLKMQGKTYAVPNVRPMTQVILARKDILDKNGVKVPTTVDEFYTEFKKLVSTGIVPLTFPKWVGNFQYFYNSFGAYYGLAQDKNGKWIDGFNTPEMKEALTYLNKLYKEGILDKEFATNENAKMREKQWAGKAASSVYWGTVLMQYQVESKKQDPKAENIVIPELKGPKGGGCMNVGIQDAFGVSAKTKEAEGAVRFLDWYCGTIEAKVIEKNGIKGKHYDLDASGIAKATEEATKAGFKFDASGLLNALPKGDMGFKLDADTQKYMDQNLKALEDISKVLGPRYVAPTGKSDSYDKTKSSYTAKLDELSTKIVMGSMAIDAAYKEYEAFWKSINGDKFLEELNK